MSGTLTIDLSLPLVIEYEVLENPLPCRHYPIDIVSVKHRGKGISTLHVGDILALQRSVYNRLVESGEVDLPPANQLGLEEYNGNTI